MYAPLGYRIFIGSSTRNNDVPDVISKSKLLMLIFFERETQFSSFVSYRSIGTRGHGLLKSLRNFVSLVYTFYTPSRPQASESSVGLSSDQNLSPTWHNRPITSYPILFIFSTLQLNFEHLSLSGIRPKQIWTIRSNRGSLSLSLSISWIVSIVFQL